MPAKKPNSIYYRDGNLDIELYTIRSTRKSKVPSKVSDPKILGLVGQAINRMRRDK